MALRIYLDTSVLSALGDSRAPDRQSMTREFFARLRDFDACTSDLARIEIERTRDPTRRREMLTLLGELTVHATTSEAESLAQRYIDAGIIPAGVPEDALHVASAVLLRQEALVSWNFKHLVNLRRRAAVQSMNASLGLPPIAIIPPPEL